MHAYQKEKQDAIMFFSSYFLVLKITWCQELCFDICNRDFAARLINVISEDISGAFWAGSLFAEWKGHNFDNFQPFIIFSYHRQYHFYFLQYFAMLINYFSQSGGNE